MRTTLTLDPDNAIRLERLRKERDAAFKDIVNDAIRRGLDSIERVEGKKPFELPLLHCGKPNFSTPEELKELMAQIQEEDDIAKLQRSGFK
ncbi:MAG: hypothetical protein JO167_02485 [Alphaproteobacteria bacterium]|nr:hypothetical protein [Alphaproteobacteria bacterium]MBV9540109.1 hypothetical protein [Alphaproteobacteria bacterium]MBV9905753.1 hypothetical protein [Alphaproteobacteria bacterium]